MKEPFELVLDFKRELDGLSHWVAGIGPDQDLWLIATEPPKPWWRRRTRSEPPESYRTHDAVILRFTADGSTETVVRIALPDWTSFVQPLPGGEFLVATPRTGGMASPNARVIDAPGLTVRELLFGDGIKDVQTSALGEIWVSYFDEGVYGGVWRSPSG